MSKLMAVFVGMVIGITLLVIYVWSIAFVGSLAVGGLVSLMTDMTVLSDAILVANYAVGVFGLWFVILSITGNVKYH